MDIAKELTKFPINYDEFHSIAHFQVIRRFLVVSLKW